MKKIIIAVLAVCAVLAAAGIYMVSAENGNDKVSYAYKETTVERGNVTAGVTESGSISIDTVEQTYDLDFLSAKTSTGLSFNSSQGASSDEDDAEHYLEVEEVYVSEGVIVQKGDPVMKLTDESIENVRQDLQKEIDDAKEELANAQYDDKETLLKAKHEYDSNIAAGETAQWVYDNAIKKLAQKITDIETDIEETNKNIDEVNEDLAELEAWNDGNNNEDYTDTKEKLDDELKKYQTQLESLNMDLKQAQIDQKTGEVSAKETYDNTIFNYDNAQYIYDKKVEEVGNATEDAQEKLDEAEENMESFLEFIGDGTIYAASAGTVTSCGYEQGDELSTSKTIAVYADMGKITMSVDVMQDDLSAVNIGDTVQITFVAYPDTTYTGTVKAIGDATTSSSTVSYKVTVTVDTYPERMLTGMTGSVTFVTKEVTDVLYVSNKAITRDGTHSYVKYYDADGNVVQKEITTGFSNGVNVEISGDVEDGDVLLIESQVNG